MRALVQLVATGVCQGCDWTQTGDPTAVDRAAEKHGKATGHSTSVVSVPSQ